MQKPCVHFSTRLLRFLAITLLLCWPGGCRQGDSVTPSESDTPASLSLAGEVKILADDYVEQYFAAHPTKAPQNGAPDWHATELGEHSLEAIARWQGQEDELYERLEAIEVSAGVDASATVTLGVLRHLLEASRDLRICRMELWNVNTTFTGWQAEMTVLARLQATSNAAEKAAALERFSKLPGYIDREISNLRRGLELGYSAWQGNVKGAIEQMNTMMAADLDDSPFVAMASAADLPEDESFRQALVELETTAIRPALERYRDYLRDEYLAAARLEPGVDSLPGGAACYRASVRWYATVDMPPERIHQTGLDQLALIDEEIRDIGMRSYPHLYPEDILAKVKADPATRFAGRKELIAFAQDAVDRAKDALPRAFGNIPKAGVIIEPYPSFQEKHAPIGQAVPPTPDGRPGVYLINTYQAEQQSRVAGIESTAFHEAYPGHHLQYAIGLEREGLHPISRYFFLSGFGEGWALYSERLCDELGLFSSDADRLGLLSSEAHRAARLVVDSGLHSKGWSRQEAVDFLASRTALTRAQAEAETDRYIAVPGQATSYMIGNLEIRRLRELAEATLGEDFDLRLFHDLVLEDGTVPLWLLEDKVQRWLADWSVN